jgi:hypothetical protein
MRLALLAAALLAAAGVGSAYAAGAFGGDQRPRTAAVAAPPPPPGAVELASIRHVVLRAATKMGDPTPTAGVVVPTTRRLAELVDVDTDEADTPVYFVLVRGTFTDSAARLPKGAKPPTGTILTLTIDPTTNESLGGGLVRSIPDVAAMGKPEPLALNMDTSRTTNVPCADGHRHLVGPDVLRGFRAVTAVSCVEGTRTYPGRGQWSVRIRRVAVGDVAALQRYFEQPNRPGLPQGGFCDGVAHFRLVPTFVDARGRWLVPRVPVDGCGEPLPGAPKLRWRAVAVRRIRLMVSAAALAAHCAMAIKDLPGDGIGPLTPTRGGPLFKSIPKTARACIYRTRDFEVGSFVRGFALGGTQTHRLLGALTRPAPSGSCPDAAMFAVVSSSGGRWAEVELGGCRRVGRTYPEYGLGGSDPAAVRAILGTR